MSSNHTTAGAPISIVFLMHLVVPSALVIEMVLRWAAPNTPPGSASLMGAVEHAVLAVMLGWLFIGVGAVRWCKKELIIKSMVSIYSTYAAVVIVFIIIAGFGVQSTDPSLWPPSRSVVLSPDPQYLPGLEGLAAFTTNQMGLRGPEWPGGFETRTILAIGGSTTESLYLDDSEAWPSLLMDLLPDTWVGNAGQSGRNTIDHFVLMESLPVVREVDLVIFLIGVNELQPAITVEGAITAEVFRQRLENGGREPSQSMTALRSGKLYQAFVHSGLARRMGVPLPSTESQLGMGSGVWFEELRRRRQNAVTLPMADLSVGLAEYERRILRLDAKCEEYGNRCVYLTQPSLWAADLSQAEEELLWLGWVGPLHQFHQSRGYVSAADLADGMDRFNSTLLAACTNQGLECYDLAAAIPKTSEYFYDDVHMTEAGSRLVAKWLAGVLGRD